MAVLTLEKPLLDVKNILGEGPLWHPNEQRLYWLDIDGQLLQTYEPEMGTYLTHRLPEKCGALAFREQGGLILATERALASWHPTSGMSPYLATFYTAEAPQLMNDGKCDPQGRFWVGAKGPAHGSHLFRIIEAFKSEMVLENLTISNGLDWTDDGRSFYHTDSYAQAIHKYKYDPVTGSISDPDLFFETKDGTPDGLTLDSAGNLWVALWDGRKVLHLDPSGQQIGEIEVPVSRPTSVALGGKDLRDLYITSASVGLSPEMHAKEPFAGSLFVCRVETPGRPCNFFAG